MLKTLIIGGVAGGATTAARLRRRDEEREIVILERGEYISYANCGLPYYIGEVIDEREKLIVQTVEQMSTKFKIDIRNLSEVIKIDKENKSKERRCLHGMSGMRGSLFLGILQGCRSQKSLSGNY